MLVWFALKRDSAQSAALRLKAQITPEAFVLSEQGSILYRGRIDNEFPALGARRSIVTERDLDNALAALVRGKSPKTKQTSPVGCMIEYSK